MFKVKYKHQINVLAWFWCFYCTYFTSFSTVSIADFEQVNVSWEYCHFRNVPPCTLLLALSNILNRNCENTKRFHYLFTTIYN